MYRAIFLILLLGLSLAVDAQVISIGEVTPVVRTEMVGAETGDRFIFVNVLTDIPIMETVSINDSTTAEINTRTFYEKNYQCQGITFGAKEAILVDVDGTRHVYPIDRVLRIWRVRK